MPTIGVVAEYNPFHTGHHHQIRESRARLGTDSAVVVAMSGNWVQQADCAVADKWLRARLAVLGGADLVLELPTVWAVSSAETFARGAVSLLAATGVVDHLSFGSESGEVEGLLRVARCLDGPELTAALRPGLDGGLSFPAARQRAVEGLLGEDGKLLARPNDTLGIEYLRALAGLAPQIQPMAILRRGRGHGGVAVLGGTGDAPPLPEHTSATDLRGAMLEGRWDYMDHFLIPGAMEILRAGAVCPSGLERCQRAILARLRTMTAEDWSLLPDSGAAEGLPQRLAAAGRAAMSVEGFWDEVKTKRYAHARLRRLVLWAFLGLTERDRPATPPYLRVLACNARGQGLLKQMKQCATLPIVTRPAQTKGLGEEARRLFETEARCTDLYALCFPEVRPAGLEWTTSTQVLD